MIEAGSVISYMNMCLEEGASLQRGMNFRLDPKYSVVLMSVRPGAPYMDAVQDSGKTLIYEGHNVPRAADGPEPKTVDQDRILLMELPPKMASLLKPQTEHINTARIQNA